MDIIMDIMSMMPIRGVFIGAHSHYINDADYGVLVVVHRQPHRHNVHERFKPTIYDIFKGIVQSSVFNIMLFLTSQRITVFSERTSIIQIRIGLKIEIRFH